MNCDVVAQCERSDVFILDRTTLGSSVYMQSNWFDENVNNGVRKGSSLSCAWGAEENLRLPDVSAKIRTGYLQDRPISISA